MATPPDAFTKWITVVVSGLILLAIPYIGNRLSDLTDKVEKQNMRLVVIETTLKLQGIPHDMVLRMEQEIKALHDRVSQLEAER